MVDQIFDPLATMRFRARALRIGDSGAAFLLNRAAEDMADRLSLVDRKFESAIVTSGNQTLLSTDFLAGTRHDGLNFGETLSADVWATRSEETPAQTSGGHDLALSFLTLHETNDTPGALVQIRNRLKPDGLFLGVMLGAGTLNELRECLLVAETEITGGAGPRVHPFADVRAVGGLMQRAGFALPVVDGETVTVRYGDMFALMRDLRAMGAVNSVAVRNKTVSRKDIFLRAAQIYHERFAQADGKIPATFNFIWMSGWAPDVSQPKPAKRGSATKSLASALEEAKNTEI